MRPRSPRKPGGGATASSLRAGEQGAPPGLTESWRVVGPGFLSSGSPGPKRGIRRDIMHPHVAHAHREKAHRTRRETRSYDTARGSQRKISRADGFQAKASEEYSSAAWNPEPGPSGRCNREQAPPRKADAKAELSSKLPDDVKGGVDCGVDAGESADVEIRHDLPGVFTGNGAAHGQNFKSSTKSDALTELPGCREWVVSRAQRRARVTQTDGGSPCLYEIRAVFPKEGFSLRTAAVKQADNCLFAPGLIVRFVLTSGPNYPHDESADVEIRHDLPGVFTGNGAAHGQNFKSSAKSEPPTELPGCQEWVVSRAQRRARVTQTDVGSCCKERDDAGLRLPDSKDPGERRRFTSSYGKNADSAEWTAAWAAREKPEKTF
ncbi:hypothetical protein JEQ12_013085 [Ovis aries]|uniref:Uncharacterized protein n=1 Tax=Ovis aries TaxID=9940 RepID=A0A835ZNP1_SHEEP|nr:hypothetical protein JEQ12_013085 [Ovis aries]